MKVIGGAEGDRTPDLRIANAALCQTELLPHESENTVSSFEFQVSSFETSADYAERGTVTKRHKRHKQSTLTNHPPIAQITQIQVTHHPDGVGLGDAAGSGRPARVAVNVPEPRPTTCTVPLI